MLLKTPHLLKITINFLAVAFLLTLIGAPFYFARSFSQVAGVKSDSSYLVISQIEKFPGMFLSQTENQYELSFEKQNPTQAYISVLILNNPTNQAHNYSLQASSGSTTVFFGEDIQNLASEVNVPPNTSVPISLISRGESASIQTVEFTIQAR